jgi:Na+/proline symporter
MKGHDRYRPVKDEGDAVTKGANLIVVLFVSFWLLILCLVGIVWAAVGPDFPDWSFPCPKQESETSLPP